MGGMNNNSASTVSAKITLGKLAGQQKDATSRAVVWAVDSYTARFDDVERPDVVANVRRDRDARRTLADLKLAVAAAFGDASAFELIEDEIEIEHPTEMTV